MGKLQQQFRVVYSKNGKTREVLIRKNIRIKNAEIIENIHQNFFFFVFSWIKVPQFVVTKDKSLSALDGESIWTALDFVDGEHFSGSPDELSQIATEIAKIHKAFREHKETYLGLSAFTWEMEDLVFVFEIMKKIDADLQEILLSKEKTIKEIASRTLSERKKHTKKNFQIIHNDLHPHNTIFKDGKLSAVIDFDNVRYAELLIDLGQAIHRFVRQYMVFNKSHSQDYLNKGVDIFLKIIRRLAKSLPAI